MDLERIEARGQTQVRREAEAPAVPLSKSRTIRSEIDLRGKTVKRPRCGQVSDDAFLSSLGRVHLIHGKGTGALGEAIHQYLGTHPHVQAFRYGAPSEGGHGVTVVDIHLPS